MWRAILNREDCQHLAAPGKITYVGQEFPTLANGQPQEPDFAVLKVDAEEGDAQWRPGFYRVDADLMELNSVLLTLARLARLHLVVTSCMAPTFAGVVCSRH